jgi:hypothetical protein
MLTKLKYHPKRGTWFTLYREVAKKAGWIEKKLSELDGLQVDVNVDGDKIVLTLLRKKPKKGEKVPRIRYYPRRGAYIWLYRRYLVDAGWIKKNVKDEYLNFLMEEEAEGDKIVLKKVEVDFE